MKLAKIQYLRGSKELYGGGLKPATEKSCGFDLRACFGDDADDIAGIVIEAGERFPIPTGIALDIQAENTAAFLYSRSGLGARTGLTVAQGVGVIDPDYRGEIIAYMLNTSKAPIAVKKGDRIAQLVFQPYVMGELSESDSLSETERGAGGFGHTGRK